MPDFPAPSNPDCRPLPSLAAILDHFARLGYGGNPLAPVPSASAIIVQFSRLGSAAASTEGGR